MTASAATQVFRCANCGLRYRDEPGRDPKMCPGCIYELTLRSQGNAAPATEPREFHCPLWPRCQCPDGTIRDDCPGITIDNSSQPAANEAMARAQADPTAPSPRRAPEWYREHFTAQHDKAEAEAEARRRRSITAEKLISDMSAVFQRCERGLQELSAIQMELAMISNDMCILHGVPRDPATPK